MERQELDLFLSFYRTYYGDDIASLAQRYPKEQRSLHVDYDDLHTFDADLAERYLQHPKDMQRVAEEALRTYDLPVDISLGQAHVRVRNLPDDRTIELPVEIADDVVGTLVKIDGIVTDTSEVKPRVTEAAFECQRCGTMTYIPQAESGFQEPHECQGCERQGPFRMNTDQSEFIDAQTIFVAESHNENRLKVILEDDLCRDLVIGDNVTVAGVLRLINDGASRGGGTFKYHLAAILVSLLDQGASLSDSSYLGMELDADESELPSKSSLQDWANRTNVILSEQHDLLEEWTTQTKIVTPFLHILGWNVYSKHVVQEYHPPDGVSDKRADYTLLDDEGSTQLVVEAKRPQRELDQSMDQLAEYLRLYGVDRGLLTNGRRYIVLYDFGEDEFDETVVLDANVQQLVSRRELLHGISPAGVDVDIEELAVPRIANQDGDWIWDVDPHDPTDEHNPKMRSLPDPTDLRTSQDEKYRRLLLGIVEGLDTDDVPGAPVAEVLGYTLKSMISREKIERDLQELSRSGDLYESADNYLKTT